MKKTAFITLLITLGLFFSTSLAVGETVFGPQQYIQTGTSITYTDTFPAAPGQGTLIVLNGQENGKKRISSATVKLNGQVIFDESDFNQSIYQLEAVVTLIASNTLEVTLKNNKKNSYITIEVIGSATPPPTVSISSAPVTIQAGESSTLTWSSTDADTASIDQGIGSVPVNGSTDVSPTETTTYTITVTGPGGTDQDSATVTVTVAPPTFPDGSFAKRYEDLIPPDATATYDPKRFSLITGLVNDINSSPVSGVSVTIHKHPEYGTATTDVDGRFTIPVNGGGTITVVYGKDGFIPAHRKVHVPWNDIAIAPDIVMIIEDNASTEVIFDGNPDTVVTHKSTTVTDEFGSRSCSLVFTGDNTAYEMDAEGNVINTLTTITTRATEFTKPDSMPAILPPTSAYTYCAEFSVDGVQRVKFNKPVVTWVNNFLGFDTGERVPVGYYDRDKAVWLPSNDGLVVTLLDTNSDGIVDALDSTGDGQPDDLNNSGSFADEVIGLQNSSQYIPGDTYWRVETDHFTPGDFNWPYGLPPGAGSSNSDASPSTDQEKECSTTNTSSFVENRTRVFHEDIPISGTDMTLHYASNRVRGYQYHISVPASGEDVPASLERIVVRVEVAGQTLEQELPPQPYQSADFIWDGRDHLGNYVSGSITAHIRIGFVYQGVYYSSTEEWTQSFGQSGGEATFIFTRQEIILWKDFKKDIKVQSGRGDIAEGWTLSSHHRLFMGNSVLLSKGDGTVIITDAYTSKFIITVAGIPGSSGYYGDGGLATEAKLNDPCGVAADSLGNIYIADKSNNRIRKVDTNGIITTIAGNGDYDYWGDGGLATEARLGGPTGVSVDSLGNIYIVDRGNGRIRKVDTDGIITTVAGGGSSFDDGGPAIEAQLNWPNDVAVDSAGNLYIADTNNGRIRKVNTDGIITTVAGGGSSYDDDIPATQTQIDSPPNVAVDLQGNIYIVDRYYDRIRKVDTSGIITTVAGGGSSFDDGIPATEAFLSWAHAVAVDPSGNIYITERGNGRIRKVDTNGIITTVAGGGSSFQNECPATFTSFFNPVSLATGLSGDIYIAEGSMHVIRKLYPPPLFVKYGLTLDEIIVPEESGIGNVFNWNGQHLKTIDLDTGVTLKEFTYNEDNQLISITNQFGNQTTINRDANGVPLSITSPDGITTQLTVDGNNHLTGITYPDGSHYDFDYTTDGLLTTKTEPEGNIFGHSFSSTGRLTDALDEEGGHWVFDRTVTPEGDIITTVTTGEGNTKTFQDFTYSTGAFSSIITDATGAETELARTDDRLYVTKTLPCGMSFSFTYDVDPEYKFKVVKEMTESTPSLLTRTTLYNKTYEDTNTDEIKDLITETIIVNGKATISENDTLQSMKTLTSPMGRAITSYYDANNLLTTQSSIPGLFDTTYGYDTAGRLTSITTSTRNTTFSYNPQGFLASITDPESHTTNYTYDPVGRVTQIEAPNNYTLDFTYDLNGNMTILTNPSSINHGFGYNFVKLNSSYQTPISGNYNYIYDKDRRLIQTVFPSGKTIDNIYNNIQLQQIQTPEGNIDFTYLCSTKVESITKGSEAINYTYDGKLITSEIRTGTLNQTLQYTYNSDFNLDTFTYAGQTINYAYDNDDLLTGAGTFTITRNALNGLPESVSGGSLTLSRTFSGYGEIDSQNFTVSGSSLTSFNLTRDNRGKITNKTETVNGTTANYIYTYDGMGRLLTVTKDSVLVEEYQYNANGTKTYEMNSLRGIAGRTLTYSNEDHLLTAGSSTYQYDVDGFLNTKTDGADVTTYTYSSRGELLSVTLPSGTVITYDHDPTGRRIAKKVNGVITEKYLWRGLTRLLAVYDGSNNLIQRFNYADGRMPASMTAVGATYYMTYDQVGSLRVVSDSAGNVVKRLDYDSFGNIIGDSNPSYSIPFGFAGGLHDRDTNLVRFGYRDYGPDVGRWTAKDPILFAGGDTDLYGYCLNDPINYYDEDGTILMALAPLAPYVIGAGFVAWAAWWAWEALHPAPLDPCRLSTGTPQSPKAPERPGTPRNFPPYRLPPSGPAPTSLPIGR
ncbi:MAG: RHS repeat-associated core domain-containing protein [Pseudomonadota bacterium]